MSRVELDSGCCGEMPKTSRVTLLGVYTLCFPLALLLLALRPALRLLGSSPAGELLAALERANGRLLAQAELFPRGKCRAASALYEYSPRLSGFVFKHFNMLVFSAVTLAAAGALAFLWTL